MTKLVIVFKVESNVLNINEDTLQQLLQPYITNDTSIVDGNKDVLEDVLNKVKQNTLSNQDVTLLYLGEYNNNYYLENVKISASGKLLSHLLDPLFIKPLSRRVRKDR